MALKTIKLGELIEQVLEVNTELKYGLDDVKGMTLSKEIIPTKADINPKELPKFIIVSKYDFIFNPRTHGKKIGFGFNEYDKKFLISWNNIAFRVKEDKQDVLLPYYLWIWLKRDEWDRFATFNSWGSSTEVFSWDSLCDMNIELPDLTTQQKYVDVYLAMIENQKAYEKGLNDIKLAMDSYFDKIKHSKDCLISNLIEFSSDKNYNLNVPFSQLRGINEFGEFTATRGSIGIDDVDKYLIIKHKSFAVNFMCLGNFGKFYLSYNDFGEDYLVSPACNCFKIKNKEINPYYLLYVFQRSEFQRECVVLGDGNTRGGINITDFSNISIPVASSSDQTIISNLYLTFENRRKLNDRLKNQIKDICPILIKGAIEEGKK